MPGPDRGKCGEHLMWSNAEPVSPAVMGWIQMPRGQVFVGVEPVGLGGLPEVLDVCPVHRVGIERVIAAKERAELERTMRQDRAGELARQLARTQLLARIVWAVVPALLVIVVDLLGRWWGVW